MYANQRNNAYIMNRKLSQLYYTRICSTLPPPQGRRHSKRVTNPATAECNTSRCVEDTSLPIAYFSSDRLDRPDRYTRDFKYPLNQKSAGVKSGDRGGHGYLQRLLTIQSSTNVCIRNALTGLAV
ncbi:hypothetical protein TNCV_2447821 [Trichonephila clavipes]|uniref:Uncharacterized protein n=1 Tax=Trichonephila clavipes TaxID=2585209 RepID=A0A8X6SQG6_TRICX|nr:hypothetical protein TNCV_2447821 [Trichonephila clavipes]